VPVPGDPDHIMYVWLDALTNYITGLGFPDAGNKTSKDAFFTHWPADLHIIGKDIVRFHAVYWPAFLMSAKIPLPKKVFGHGFLNIEGAKMSKSLGNVLSPEVMVEEFGLDPIRYFLLREVPYGQDGSFTREGIIQRINADLANDLGNLAQRSLSLINKNCNSKMPDYGKLKDEDNELLRLAMHLLVEVREAFEVQAFHVALDRIWSVVRAANIYIDHQAPWVLRREDPDRMQTVLFVLAEVIRRVAILAQPVVPAAAGKLLDQLGVTQDARNFSELNEEIGTKPYIDLPKPVGVFPRFLVRSDE